MIRVESEADRVAASAVLSSLVCPHVCRTATNAEQRRFDQHLEAIVRYDMRMAATGDAVAMRMVRMYRDENAIRGDGVCGLPYPWVDDDDFEAAPPSARAAPRASDPRAAGLDAMRARAKGGPGC